MSLLLGSYAILTLRQTLYTSMLLFEHTSVLKDVLAEIRTCFFWRGEVGKKTVNSGLRKEIFSDFAKWAVVSYHDT